MTLGSQLTEFSLPKRQDQFLTPKYGTSSEEYSLFPRPPPPRNISSLGPRRATERF